MAEAYARAVELAESAGVPVLLIDDPEDLFPAFDSFASTVYRDGKNVAECRIVRGGFIDGGITYSNSARREGNGINESLSVEADGQGMYLKAMMSMLRMASSEDPKLTFEGAAEYYWSMLVGRLQ